MAYIYSRQPAPPPAPAASDALGAVTTTARVTNGRHERLEFWPYRGAPQTVALMTRLVKESERDQRVRKAAQEIVCDIYPKDHLSEAAAIYYWLISKMRYTRDPAHVERVQSPAVSLENRAVDCDELAALASALAAAIGSDFRFATVGMTPGGQYTHVFAAIKPAGEGYWVVVDPVAAPRADIMLKRVRQFAVYDSDGKLVMRGTR